MTRTGWGIGRQGGRGREAVGGAWAVARGPGAAHACTVKWPAGARARCSHGPRATTLLRYCCRRDARMCAGRACCRLHEAHGQQKCAVAARRSRTCAPPVWSPSPAAAASAGVSSGCLSSPLSLCALAASARSVTPCVEWTTHSRARNRATEDYSKLKTSGCQAQPSPARAFSHLRALSLGWSWSRTALPWRLAASRPDFTHTHTHTAHAFSACVSNRVVSV